jgi:hypothetical protein
MTHRQILLLGVATSGIALCVTYAVLRSDGAGRPDTTRASSTSSATVLDARPKESHGGHTDAAEQLASEVARLRAEVSALRDQAASSGPASPNEGEQRSPASRAEAEARYQVYMGTVESAFRAEPDNPAWSQPTLAAVYDAIEQSGIPRSTLRQVECRSHTCRLEIAEEGSAGAEGAIPMLLNRLGARLPSTIGNHIDEGDATPRTLLYLSDAR